MKLKITHTKYGNILNQQPKGIAKRYENLEYEKHIVDKIPHYTTFIDVGASCGYHTVIAANHCSQVISYEANPFIYGILLYNTRTYDNVLCKYAWVGSSHSTPTLREYNHMCIQGIGNQYNVPIIHLKNETFDLQNTLIKIDVESGEKNVLQGCSKSMLDKCDFIIEIHTEWGVKKETIFSFFSYHKKINKRREIYLCNNTQ